MAAISENGDGEGPGGEESPDAPVCTHCAGRDLKRSGWQKGKQRYTCRACGRYSYGVPAKEPTPCPYCGGHCRRSGVDGKGRQKYYCTGCGRSNTGLWPWEPLLGRDAGHYTEKRMRHRLCLNMGLRAVRALDAYCQGHRMTEAQAIRDIFRKYAREPRVIAATARRHDPPPRRSDEEIVREEGVPAQTPLRFPNLSAETTGKRTREGAAGAWTRTIALERQVTLWLDDVAAAGLLKAMRRTDKNYQEAARWLVENAERRWVAVVGRRENRK